MIFGSGLEWSRDGCWLLIAGESGVFLVVPSESHDNDDDFG